ncbi:threonine-phosphate decarboxylase CobD [Neorhizobium galegae]|uniref:threonine-phosphate decarboxylase CobD n=1 Tax=Neorhizobium galegae TaxID=399 RepID=UPI000621D05C|nr:threonine-phosphate decarboxylase CobD [Neorhizobium galegae]MCQ1769398.1 threonine-phosphate decarboxylase CobD [Neorhizobium galegae]MCQ1848856.1 threonine-phosphate decarboxylase CobD [Neorhizobium galegae]CDZ42441.1 Threonine-phosphate decarboxylase [Neorhizobium galegae bv. officinalis]
MAGPEIGDRIGDPIQHGGNLSRARALFPHAPEPWVDLSTGISPHSYPHSPLPGNAFTRLPEVASAERLKVLAAAAYGVPSAAHVAAGPGTQILLPMVADLIARKGQAAVLSPTYAEHARAARLAGFEVMETADLDRLAEADLAVIVNPNNPTGRIVSRADLLALAAIMRAKGGFLVVDEAFMDVAEASSVTDAVDAGGLVVLRSFGKFYGMAGLRLGFVISHPETIARIENRLGPWAVSGPALHVANEALGDTEWQNAMRLRLKEDAARLDALLGAAGIPVADGTSLFRFIRDPRAQAIFRHLGEKGILVRRFEERPDDLRIGLPGDSDWPRLEEALRSI